MKIFQRILILALVLSIALVFVALCVRIYMNEHYPKEATRIVFTDALTEHYQKDPDGFAAYTQSIRVPYDDSEEGGFFAHELILVPSAGNLQITMRYNESVMKTLQEKYKLPEPPLPTEGMFTYRLTVSYLTEDKDGLYKTYDSVYAAESTAFMYTYTKLVFDGVELDGAVWARVDIYYADQKEPLGSVAVYEASMEYEGQRVEYPLKKYRVKKGDLPK